MALKPTSTKGGLKETAEDLVQVLEGQLEECASQIKLMVGRKEDIERKVRWIRKELLDN